MEIGINNDDEDEDDNEGNGMEIPKCGSKKIKLYANVPLWP